MMGTEGDKSLFVWSRRNKNNNKIGERRDQWTAFPDRPFYLSTSIAAL